MALTSPTQGLLPQPQEPHLSSAQGFQSHLGHVVGAWVSSSACPGLWTPVTRLLTHRLAS